MSRPQAAPGKPFRSPRSAGRRVGRSLFGAALLFVAVVVVAQDGVPTAMAGLVIGLTLTLIYLAGITVSGPSVNPARSIGPALIQGGEAINQLWLYIVAPLISGAIGGKLHQSGITTKDTDD